MPTLAVQKIAIISAMTRGRVIGSGDGMPWEIPEEYQHFLDTTCGESIIIGRRSFEIFGPTLTSAHCFVVTRGTFAFSNAVSVASIDEAIELARETKRKIFVAGGASIYAAALPFAEEMLLSFIEGDFPGDSYFPEFDESDWTIAEQKDRGRYEFVRYVRRTR